jgi:hypothetical protein
MDAGGAVGDIEVGCYPAGLSGMHAAIAGSEDRERQKEEKRA